LISGTGAPATSTGVRYTLLPRGAGWALQVDLDQAWLADPARVWPVTVDPALQVASEQDDTFVSTRDYANQNNSAQSDLLIGTYDWGGEVSESYLHFDSAMSQLAGKYVTSASLSLFNDWSYSCTGSAASVHAVGQPWAGSSTTSWGSRPAYDGTALDTESVAFGSSGCAQGPTWATWPSRLARCRCGRRGRPRFMGLRCGPPTPTRWGGSGSGRVTTAIRRIGRCLSVTYSLQPAGVQVWSPGNDGVTDSLTPTFVGAAGQSINAPVLQYKFKVCSVYGTGADPTAMRRPSGTRRRHSRCRLGGCRSGARPISGLSISTTGRWHRVGWGRRGLRPRSRSRG